MYRALSLLLNEKVQVILFEKRIFNEISPGIYKQAPRRRVSQTKANRV
jgi:hypothetical protein